MVGAVEAAGWSGPHRDLLALALPDAASVLSAAAQTVTFCSQLEAVSQQLYMPSQGIIPHVWLHLACRSAEDECWQEHFA